MSNGNRGTGIDETVTADLQRSVVLLSVVTDALATVANTETKTDRSTLAQTICDVLVANGDVLVSAWVGTTDDSDEVSPIASAERDGEESVAVSGQTSKADTSGDTLIQRALSEDQILAGSDTDTDADTRHTAIAIPLRTERETVGEDVTVGVLVVSGVGLELTDPVQSAFSSLGDAVATKMNAIETSIEDADTQCRRQLSAIFESTFEFLCLLDPDGTILRVNDAALEFGDHDRAAIIDQFVWETPWWHGNEDRKAALKEAISHAASGEFVRYEVEFETGDSDDTAIIDFSLSPVFDEDGAVKLLVSEGHDITAQREHAQDLQRERERLEFMNRILRHNLLNGLNVVGARADILQGFVADDGEQHLETIQHRVEEMTELVGTMRTFMKAIVEGETQEFESRSLREAVQSCVETVERDSPNVTVSLGAIPPIPVRADELLDEVVENLLKNAIQHNDKPAPEVSIEAAAGDQTVELWISDNGPGVPDEQKRKIVEKTIEELSNPGSGFGLFLVREIVESYGGDIRIDDNTPEGATFVVTLPRA
ncbi:ATP-binding protein [Haloferax sp. DFSO60]|uniref:ATP-binding protein n=1 Tax=Haloferax sp. DFSO60 TaxID=3388652 RepID=UPI003977E6A4